MYESELRTVVKIWIQYSRILRSRVAILIQAIKPDLTAAYKEKKLFKIIDMTELGN